MARGPEAWFCGAVRRVSGAGFAQRRLADSMGVALRPAYTRAKAVDLLLSMGFPVSRETAVCAASTVGLPGRRQERGALEHHRRGREGHFR